MQYRNGLFSCCFVSFETHAGDAEYRGPVADRDFPRKQRPLKLKHDSTHREKSHHPQESKRIDVW